MSFFDGTASGFAPPGVLPIDFARRPREPARPRRWRLGALLVLAGGALAGAFFARNHNPDLLETAGPPPFSRIGFVVVERLAPMLSFRLGDNLRVRTRYQARVRAVDAERWDTLSVGGADDDDIQFQATVHIAKSAFSKPSLFVALARQSAELDAAIVHAKSAHLYSTARTTVEWMEITLSDEKGERTCIGFRFAGSRQVDLSGLACGTRSAPLDAGSFVHLIDRLSATDAGMEAGIGEALGNKTM